MLCEALEENILTGCSHFIVVMCVCVCVSVYVLIFFLSVCVLCPLLACCLILSHRLCLQPWLTWKSLLFPSSPELVEVYLPLYLKLNHEIKVMCNQPQLHLHLLSRIAALLELVST